MPLGVAMACATWCDSSICQSRERRMSGHLYTVAVGYQNKGLDNTMPVTVNCIYRTSLWMMDGTLESSVADSVRCNTRIQEFRILMEFRIFLYLTKFSFFPVFFWRWRVCKAQKTPLFSIAVTHRPHIFYSCMSSHPKTHIFSFNLSLNAPWFEKLPFEKNTSIDHNEVKHESNVAWGFLAYSLLYNPGD